MILIELVFDAPPGEQENVANLARRTTAATRRENGCILYRFTAGLDHPSRFILTELWESEEHLKLTSQAKHSRTSGLNYPGEAASSAAQRGRATYFLRPTQPGQ